VFLKRREKDFAGYTLLEVTIALIIIGISLGVVFGELSRSKSLSFKADFVLDSVRILHNLTENSQLIGKAIRDDGVKGDVPGEKGWMYSIKAVPLELKLKPGDEPVEIPGMKSLKICIKREHYKKEYCITRWYREK
jgi:prepilin-type N-terminal cleavage/methylation domain-containing protein